MRFHFTQQQDAFRREVHDFVAQEIEAGTFAPNVGELVGMSSRAFSRKLADRGWIGMTWPRQYGGQERGAVDKMIMNEELMRVQAPIGYHFMGDRQVGPAIIIFGSPWQKEFFLPRIVKAEEKSNFCLLFSEPGAGSDLVSVAIRAERVAAPVHFLSPAFLLRCAASYARRSDRWSLV